MSYITNVVGKGVLAEDVEHFSAYFNVCVPVVHPFATSEERAAAYSSQQEEKMARDTVSLHGKKELLQKIVDLGREGVTYTKDSFNKLLQEHD